MLNEHHETVKSTLDVMSAFTAFMAFLNVFSPLFGLVAMIWTLMRIAEMVAGKPFAEIIRKKKEEENG
jgi:hypothetical protein